MTNPEDIQLKFDGEPVKRLGGAPADAVIASLTALQRMVLIIGMRSEGRALGVRLKPSAKVRRDYSVICRAPSIGSHVQPFAVASQLGMYTPASLFAREELLKVLKAFDSGEEDQVKQALPNPRERWFLANAAAGLIPSEDSGLEVALRVGTRGPFGFKADRARAAIQHFRSGSPPEPKAEEIAGKLRAIDYQQTIITIKPSNNRAVRLDYPLRLEPWLQANVRRRVLIVGDPRLNNAGDITGLKKIRSLSELEPTLPPISAFPLGSKLMMTSQPLPVPVTYDYEEQSFSFRNTELGIDIWTREYGEFREMILQDLRFLWEQYATCRDDDLAPDALAVKEALNSRFVADR